MFSDKRLVLVANVEPYQNRRTKNGMKQERVRGGLISALDPMMRGIKNSLWIGWGRGESDFRDRKQKSYTIKVPDKNGYPLKRIHLTDSERELFYSRASNGMLWFLFHGFLTALAKFEEVFWKGYQKGNQKFAEAVLEEYQNNDLIWIQDYHLLLLPKLIKKQKPKAKIAFFLHVPWSTWEDGFGHFPWRKEIFDGLLAADLIGFQTKVWLKNFINCLKHLAEEQGYTIIEEEQKIISPSGHQTRCGVFPLGINYNTYTYQGNGITKKAEKLKKRYGVEHIIFALDRIDPSKGILERIKGFELFLKENRKFHKKVALVQKVISGRMGLPLYQEMKGDIDQAIGRVTAKYSQPDWNPVYYYDQHFSLEMLVSHNMISEVALVTPLVDGMNLVAKEWIAGAEKGVLILSEFAGAAEELGPEALIVNPSNIREIADAIKKALTMSEKEKEDRLSKLKEKVRKHDVIWWRQKFLKHWLSIYH